MQTGQLVLDFEHGVRPFRPLFPHQEQAVRFATDRPRCALFLEMRLGKTLCAIRATRAAGAKHVLVVAPLTVLAAWQDELTAEGVSRVHVQTENHDGEWPCIVRPDTETWCLVNYERLLQNPQWADAAWDQVILDESTRIKNPKAQITQLCTTRFRSAARRMLLSGLPAPEGMLDYYSQMRFLLGGFGNCNNYWKFRNVYFQQFGYDWRPKPGMRTVLFDALKPHAIFQTRHSVGMTTRKVYERRVIPQTAKQRHYMEEAEREWALEFKETTWKPVVHSWLAQLAGGFLPDSLKARWPKNCVNEGKIDEIVDLLQGELRGQRVVIFARFRQEIDAIRLRLSEQCSLWTITGETQAQHRRGLIAAFREAQRTAVLLCQIQCGKFGLDLSCADTAIFYSNSYALEDRAQAEDRIVHPTKRRPVLYIDLVTERSIDEDVLKALREKRAGAALLPAILANFRVRVGA